MHLDCCPCKSFCFYKEWKFKTLLHRLHFPDQKAAPSFLYCIWSFTFIVMTLHSSSPFRPLLPSADSICTADVSFFSLTCAKSRITVWNVAFGAVWRLHSSVTCTEPHRVFWNCSKRTSTTWTTGRWSRLVSKVCTGNQSSWKIASW